MSFLINSVLEEVFYRDQTGSAFRLMTSNFYNSYFMGALAYGITGWRFLRY